MLDPPDVRLDHDEHRDAAQRVEVGAATISTRT
jgi:hypothetical protein